MLIDLREKLWPAVVVLVLLLVGPACGTLRAATYVERFEGAQATWRVKLASRNAKLRSQQRAVRENGTNQRYEQAVIESSEGGASLRLEHAVPASRVIDDLKVSLLVRSNRPGATLFLRVVFPHQVDPRTGEPLVAAIQGETYDDVGKWQMLSCATLQKSVQEVVRRQRAALHPGQVDARDLFVDRVVLTGVVPRGTLALGMDELHLEGMVKVRDHEEIVPVVGEAGARGVDVDFRLDSLTVDQRSVFPRILRYHGEEPDMLVRAGANIVWVPDYRDAALISRLRSAGLHVMAEPPRAVAQGQVLDSAQAALVPFGDETADILMWYMGTRIRPSEKDDMISWIKQVKSADRRFNRPLAADITGLERVFTRYVNLAGMSRHSLNSSFDPVRQREWLSEKRKLARLGSFMWTWVQTESSVSHESGGTVAGTSGAGVSGAGVSGAVIEPEQIWLQVYSALAAGYRGVGFWKSESLGAETPGVLERRLAIALVNRELELLEPILATGTLLGPVNFTISAQKVQSVGQLGANLNSTSAAKRARVALLRERSASQRRNQQLKHELQAAVIKSRYGHLVLPIWYQTDAQFVPGKMSARSATVVVPSVPETATAWQVTASGLRSLEKKRTNAGLEVRLKDFDQRAAILITSDNAFRVAMDGKIKSLSESRASLSVELAEAKLKRVRAVDAELTALGVGQPDAPHLLGSAREWAGEARRYLGRGEFGSAHMSSMDCMKALRRLQRAHWDQAIEKLSAPTSSVYATCFQTLPDHWRMIAKLGRARSKLDGNLLRGGDFEDINVMVAERWQHHQQETEAVRATAELYPLKTGQGSCLRLVAVPEAGADPPRVVHQSPVSVISPSIPVRAGQVVHISGILRIPVPTTANLDGVTLYDTLGGASAALRWHGPQGWQRFELIRDVDRDREFVVRITLNGLGEVKVDDLRVVAFDPPGPVNSSTSAGNRPRSGESRRSALDFLPRLPKLRPLQPRN